MSKIYLATVRGKPNVIVELDERGDYWSARPVVSVNGTLYHSHHPHFVTDLVPAVVISEEDAKALTSTTTQGLARMVAAQRRVREQLKPPMDEPTEFLSVVLASTGGELEEREFVRYVASGVSEFSWSDGHTLYKWDDLVNPRSK